MRAAVVVPTNRPDRMIEFVRAWTSQFHRDDVRLIVCEDHDLPMFALPEWVEHYCWADIDKQLGERASCIPRRSGGIRDFGFCLAGNDESIDMIVSLDDDVLPLPDVDFLAEHWAALEAEHSLHWWRTTPFHVRGEPYGLERAKTVFNHGLWAGTPDVDAFAQLGNPKVHWTPPDNLRTELVPKGMGFSACGMNIAFRREVAQYYYFPKLPDGMKRWDDIWAGLILKRIADLHNWAVTSGPPVLRHERASNPLANLRQEMLGYGANERMWDVICRADQKITPQSNYRSITEVIGRTFPELADTVRQMHTWMWLW